MLTVESVEKPLMVTQGSPEHRESVCEWDTVYHNLQQSIFRHNQEASGFILTAELTKYIT